jgi:predicted transcriptional regulator
MAEEMSDQRRALNAAVEDQNKQLKTVRRIAQAISTMDDMEQVRMISLLNANQSVCNIVRTLQHETGSIAYSLRVERLLGE